MSSLPSPHVAAGGRMMVPAVPMPAVAAPPPEPPELLLPLVPPLSLPPLPAGEPALHADASAHASTMNPPKRSTIDMLYLQPRELLLQAQFDGNCAVRFCLDSLRSRRVARSSRPELALLLAASHKG